MMSGPHQLGLHCVPQDRLPIPVIKPLAVFKCGVGKCHTALANLAHPLLTRQPSRYLACSLLSRLQQEHDSLKPLCKVKKAAGLTGSNRQCKDGHPKLDTEGPAVSYEEMRSSTPSPSFSFSYVTKAIAMEGTTLI